MNKNKKIIITILAIVLLTIFKGYSESVTNHVENIVTNNVTNSVENSVSNNFINDEMEFNFDNISISTLAKIVGDLTGKTIILPNNINAKVSIISPKKLSIDKLYALFITTLQSSGYTLLENKDNTLLIIPLKKDFNNVPLYNSNEVDQVGMMTKIYKINKIPLIELKSVLVMLTSPDNIILSPSSSSVLIMDTVENIEKFDKIIEILDTKENVDKIIEVIPLNYASAEEISQQITLALTKLKLNNNSNSFDIFSNIVIPSPRVNSLIVVSNPLDMKDIKRLVNILDQEGLKNNNNPLNVVFLKYLDATEITKNLNSLIERTIIKDGVRKISIEANVGNNCLLVLSSSKDFDWVSEIVKRIDVRPKQLMIEVVIAEVVSDKNSTFGVDLGITGSKNDVNFIGKTRMEEFDTLNGMAASKSFPKGATVALYKNSEFTIGGVTFPSIPALITALAIDSTVSVKANTPLYIQNNEKASIDISKNIPILKSEVINGSGYSNNLSTVRNIERYSVGIHITLTAKINPENDITIKIDPISIESIIDPGLEGSFTPTFSSRELKTTITLQNKTTAVLSGLIREDTFEGENKVPILGDIPYLGNLFKHKTKSKTRNNLLIFITPHLISDNLEENNNILINKMPLLNSTNENKIFFTNSMAN